MGYVYLIQPKEYLKTNIYKVGMSTLFSLDRCAYGYSKESEFLSHFN